MAEHLTEQGLVEVGRRVIRDEAAGLACLADGLDAAFAQAVRRLQHLPGPLIVTGLGKSGLIARKIAATLTSTGTPAAFLHPVEALHGDLGLVGPDSALLALSRSGNTEEILKFVLHFRRLGGAVIAMTAGASSRLAELATLRLSLPDLKEACPLNLAPTTSTSMMLALGDALAMALVEARGFKPEDFARFHPDGSLGKRLLLRARDLMHGGEELPVVRLDQSMEDLLGTIDRKAMGLACLVQPDGTLAGVFTDGDLRRLVRRCGDPMGLSVAEAYRLSRRAVGEAAVKQSAVRPELPLIDCRQLMRDSRITSLVVTDAANRPLGLVRQQDIVAIGMG